MTAIWGFATADRAIESIHSGILLLVYSIGLSVFMASIILLNG